MNKYVEILILFISEYGYIKAEDFIHFAYSNIDEYEQLLDEDTYLSLLSMSFADNQSVVDFTNRLREFAEKNYAPEISNIDNDVYVDGVVESDRNALKDADAAVKRNGEGLIGFMEHQMK